MGKNQLGPLLHSKDFEHQYLLLLGQKIKSNRRQQRLTQASLSKSLGVSRASIANIERGLQRVSIFLLARIAQKLQQPVHSFIPQLAEAQKMLEHKLQVTLPETTQLVAEALKIHGITSSTPNNIKEVLESYDVSPTHNLTDK